MKKIFLSLLAVVALVPSLAFAHAAHFSLDNTTYTLGDPVLYADSASGCHGAGCSSETPGWFWYLGGVDTAPYAWCGGRTSGTFASNCTKIGDPGQLYPRAGTYTIYVNLDHNCQFNPDTKSQCAAAGGLITTFNITVVAPPDPTPGEVIANPVFAAVGATLGAQFSGLVAFFIKFGIPVIFIVGVFIFARLAMKGKQ